MKEIFSSDCYLFCDKKEWEHVCLDLIEWENSKAIITLSGLLLKTFNLLNSFSGKNLELLWFDCPNKEYKKESIIVKFSNCKPGKKSIQNIIVNNNQDDGALTISVEVKCDIKFLGLTNGTY